MTQTETRSFNPNEHLTQLKNKDYLEVKWRLVWFRDSHPHGIIKTELLRLDLDKNMAVFKATIQDGEGGIGEGHGSETAKDFGDFIEKAETKAIGRALAALGYGTQFAPELEEGERIVDSPVAQPAHKPVTKSPTQNAVTKPASNGSTTNASTNKTPQPQENKIVSEQFTKVEEIPTADTLKKDALALKLNWKKIVERVTGNASTPDDAISPEQCQKIVEIIKHYQAKQNGGEQAA